MDKVKMIISQYDEIAEEYAKKIVDKDSKLVLEIFRKNVVEGATVLDAGSAAGRDTNILSQNGYKVTGIDLSIKLLEIANRTYPELHFESGDVRKLEFPVESFDAIWSLAVLHHLEKEDVQKALKEFYRVLKPNGAVMISVKSGQGTKKIRDKHFLNKEREFHLISASELDSLLKEAGFTEKELIESKSRSGEMMWVIALYIKQ